MIKAITTSLLLMLIGGCATSVIGVPSGTASSPSADHLASQPIGSVVMLNGINYRLGETYFAASGKTCRHMLELPANTVKIACPNNRGKWYLRDTLKQSNASAPAQSRFNAVSDLALSGSFQSHSNSVNAAVAGTERLQPNERLWDFAKRITGDALNWKVIADFNDIENVRRLAPGTELKIPASLLSDSSDEAVQVASANE